MATYGEALREKWAQKMDAGWQGSEGAKADRIRTAEYERKKAEAEYAEKKARWPPITNRSARLSYLEQLRIRMQSMADAMRAIPNLDSYGFNMSRREYNEMLAENKRAGY